MGYISFEISFSAHTRQPGSDFKDAAEGEDVKPRACVLARIVWRSKGSMVVRPRWRATERLRVEKSCQRPPYSSDAKGRPS